MTKRRSPFQVQNTIQEAATRYVCIVEDYKSYLGLETITQGVKTNLADIAKLAIYASAAESVNRYQTVYIQTKSGNVYKIILIAYKWYIESGRDQYYSHCLEDISELEIGRIFSYQYTHSGERKTRNTTPIMKLIVVDNAANADFSQYSKSNIVDMFKAVQRTPYNRISSGKTNGRSTTIFGALKKWFGGSTHQAPSSQRSLLDPITQTLSSPPLSFDEELIQEQFIIERGKRAEEELKVLEEQGRQDKERADERAETERQSLLKTIYEKVHEQLKTRQLLETLNQRIYGGKGIVLPLYETSKATILLTIYDPGLHEMSAGSFSYRSTDVEYFCSGYVLNEKRSQHPNIFVGFVNLGRSVNLDRFVVATSWNQVARSVYHLGHNEDLGHESNQGYITTISLSQVNDEHKLLQSSFIESTLTRVHQSLRDIAREHFKK